MASEKRIHRAKHDTENPYYIASRQTSQDKAISYDALGLLHYLLSKPDDWVIQPSDLEREKCKRNKVYVILKELIKSTYIERIYHYDDKHRVKMVEYIAHEMPLVKNPLPENQKVENQNLGNRHITEYRTEQSTEKTKSTDAPAPSDTPVKPVVFPKSLRGYDESHIRAYQQLYTADMKALVQAWHGGMFTSITEFTTKIGRMYIEVHKELVRLHKTSADYLTLANYTKKKEAWKDAPLVTDMLLYVTEYKTPAKPVNADLSKPIDFEPILKPQTEPVTS